MESAVEPLEELASLRAMLAASQAKTGAAEAENARLIQEHARLQAHSAELAGTVARLKTQNERYEHIIAQLRRLQFGKRSEQLDKDQLQLAFEDLVQGLGEIEQEEEKADPQLKAHRTTERREKRLSLPDNLPQIEVVIEPEAGACPCCGGGLHKIGEDVSRRLDVVPAQYRVILTRRPKYACRSCEGTVVQASGAGSANRRRSSHRATDRQGPDRQVRRPRFPSIARPTRFLDDGRVRLSNNAAERALRGIALGRKSWLFCGSDRGGQRAAAMYSLIITCKMNDIDPQAWLADVLARIATHPAHRLAELLPWNWKADRARQVEAQAA